VVQHHINEETCAVSVVRIAGVFGLFPPSVILETRKNDVSETGSISETSRFLFSRIPDDGKSPKTQ
jgi:hypothetical protein